MIRIIIQLLVIASCLTIPTLSLARTVYFGSETEVIPLVFGQASLLRFPAEVKTISQAARFEIAPANRDEPNYALLEIRPRFSTGSSDVAFILSDGTVIKLRLSVVSKAVPEKTDSIYDLKSKESLLGTQSDSKTGPVLSDIEFMKALIRGDQINGYEVRNLTRTLSPGIKGVRIQLVRMYSGSQYNGYIFEISSTTKGHKLYVNLPNLVLGDPNVALLSSIDQAVLEPEGNPASKTYLRVVAKPTSLYNQLILPIEAVERK